MELVKPNYCHEIIAKLEKDYDIAIITTNIDNLHEKAGSSKVIHLHGNIFEVCDLNKEEPYYLNQDIKDGELHPKTGIQLRHNTVLFGEYLREDIPYLYKNIVKQADYLIIIGSSLSVFPSNNIIKYNDNIIYLNPTLPEDIYYDHWKVIQKNACNGIDEVI